MTDQSADADSGADGERRAIARVATRGEPVTPASLTRDLRMLGVQSGMLLNVHSSLSSLGWLAGGAQSVVHGLLDVLGDTGTLMMPTHSAQLSDPANWRNPPVPEVWWDIIRAHMPAYHPARTPTRHMGAIPETFRAWPGVLRSAHPQTSHAALGPLAEEIVAEHPLECMFGDASPMGKLYERDGHVLLLGVGHGNNTVLHLAEERVDFPGKTRHDEGAPILVDGRRCWQSFRPVKVSDDDFEALGVDFAHTGLQSVGRVGAADAIFMRVRDVVDFAAAWFPRHRS